jgi:hypothetical protein
MLILLLQCTDFAKVWANESPSYLTELKNRASTMGAPWCLSDVAWEMALGVASSSAAGVKQTSAVLQLELSKDVPEPAGSSTVKQSFAVEFSRDGLLEFLGKLDTIQQQIDSLSA